MDASARMSSPRGHGPAAPYPLQKPVELQLLPGPWEVVERHCQDLDAASFFISGITITHEPGSDEANSVSVHVTPSPNHPLQVHVPPYELIRQAGKRSPTVAGKESQGSYPLWSPSYRGSSCYSSPFSRAPAKNSAIRQLRKTSSGVETSLQSTGVSPASSISATSTSASMLPAPAHTGVQSTLAAAPALQEVSPGNGGHPKVYHQGSLPVGQRVGSMLAAACLPFSASGPVDVSCLFSLEEEMPVDQRAWGEATQREVVLRIVDKSARMKGDSRESALACRQVACIPPGAGGACAHAGTLKPSSKHMCTMGFAPWVEGDDLDRRESDGGMSMLSSGSFNMDLLSPQTPQAHEQPAGLDSTVKVQAEGLFPSGHSLGDTSSGKGGSASVCSTGAPHGGQGPLPVREDLQVTGDPVMKRFASTRERMPRGKSMSRSKNLLLQGVGQV